MEIYQKNWAPCVTPFKGIQVIRIETDQSGVYDFLLTFHSNHEPILYHFQDRARYWPKIAKSSEPMFI